MKAAARLSPPRDGSDDGRGAARDAGLLYVTDTTPGITRRRAGRGFTYIGPNGRRIADRASIERIQRLAIPPAWTDVWISSKANGHLQATGWDARHRKAVPIPR